MNRIDEGAARVGDGAPATDAPAAPPIRDETSRPFRGSREPVAWFKASFAAVVLLGGMLLVMWAQQGPRMCAMSPEASRQLLLSRPGDREHLATDNASAMRSAHQYVASEADTPDRQQRLLACEALLVRSIATTHDLTVAQVRAGAEYAQ